MKLIWFLHFGIIGLCAIVFSLLLLFTAKVRKRQNTFGQILLRTSIILTALVLLLTGFNATLYIFQHDKNLVLLEEAESYSNQEKRDLLQKITLLEDQLKAIEEEKDFLITHRDTVRATVQHAREDIAQIRELAANIATYKTAKASVSLPSDFSPQEAHVKVRFPKDEEIKNQLLEKIDIINSRLNKILD
ncbi:MAG: hypothetical protein E3K37_03945 [Candidatus Kuenenia sp.]|nr:hypothetical protein [Candidatus Kuenenia hertensis]